MAEAAVKAPEAAERELTDGFNLIIDALKLNAGYSDHGFRPHGAGRRHPRYFFSP